MKVILQTVDHAKIREFENVTDVMSACIGGHVMIQSDDVNYIVAIQKGEILVIDKQGN